MAQLWQGEYARETFFYGIEGEDERTAYPVAPTPAILEKMRDESINFTGLGVFPSHPGEGEVLARIEQIAMFQNEEELVNIPTEYLEAGYETFRAGLSAKFPRVPPEAIELASFALISIAIDGNQDKGATRHLLVALETMNSPD